MHPIKLLHHCAHASGHIDAMIGITDCGIQLGQLRLVLDHEIMKTSQPTHQLLGRDRGIRHAPYIAHPYSPHRSPAVFTGASHTSIPSSLARRTVTEQPATSSDVM